MSAKKTLRKLGLESISGHKNDHCNAFIKYDVPGTILGPGTQQPSKLIKILPPWNSCLEVGVGQITSEILTVSDGDKWRKIKQAKVTGCPREEVLRRVLRDDDSTKREPPECLGEGHSRQRP